EESEIMKTQLRLLFTAMLAPALMSVTGLALGQASDYYKDKVINIIVAGGASGGHTRYARLIQPYLQKYSGAREVRITNMPGGGGLIAASHVWRAKPDGFTILFGNVPTLILAPIAGMAGVQFDSTKFTYLGRAASEPRILAVGSKSPIKTMQDVQKLGRPFIYPSQGTDEDFFTMAVLGDALGFKIKAVTGYEGNADTTLAVIKGDGDGHITGWSESLAPIKAGDKRPILVVSSARVPDFPDVPTAVEAAPANKQAAVRAIVNIMETHRSYIGPPNMDAKATAAFRAAVSAAMKDPALLEESSKGNRPMSFMEGAEQQRVITEITKASATLAPILKSSLKEVQ
ncbi:MAG TPA: tripartite tricarboxylate transporter substrate-binding protein, partial [Burkholderiales bacterium]|nr:tripartite tricarboxylate transporter substrate-binding protein [Burkholderiales bacterium]